MLVVVVLSTILLAVSVIPISRLVSQTSFEIRNRAAGGQCTGAPNNNADCARVAGGYIGACGGRSQANCNALSVCGCTWQEDAPVSLAGGGTAPTVGGSGGSTTGDKCDSKSASTCVGKTPPGYHLVGSDCFQCAYTQKPSCSRNYAHPSRCAGTGGGTIPPGGVCRPGDYESCIGGGQMSRSCGSDGQWKVVRDTVCGATPACLQIGDCITGKTCIYYEGSLQPVGASCKAGGGIIRCGDNECNGMEWCGSCPKDCGVCKSTSQVCCENKDGTYKYRLQSDCQESGGKSTTLVTRCAIAASRTCYLTTDGCTTKSIENCAKSPSFDSLGSCMQNISERVALLEESEQPALPIGNCYRGDGCDATVPRYLNCPVGSYESPEACKQATWVFCAQGTAPCVYRLAPSTCPNPFTSSQACLNSIQAAELAEKQQRAEERRSCFDINNGCERTPPMYSCDETTFFSDQATCQVRYTKRQVLKKCYNINQSCSLTNQYTCTLSSGLYDDPDVCAQVLRDRQISQAKEAAQITCYDLNRNCQDTTERYSCTNSLGLYRYPTDCKNAQKLREEQQTPAAPVIPPSAQALVTPVIGGITSPYGTGYEIVEDEAPICSELGVNQYSKRGGPCAACTGNPNTPTGVGYYCPGGYEDISKGDTCNCQISTELQQIVSGQPLAGGVTVPLTPEPVWNDWLGDLAGGLATGIWEAPLMPGAFLDAASIALGEGDTEFRLERALGRYVSQSSEQYEIRRASAIYSFEEASTPEEFAAGLSITVFPSIGRAAIACEGVSSVGEISGECAEATVVTVLEGTELAIAGKGVASLVRQAIPSVGTGGLVEPGYGSAILEDPLSTWGSQVEIVAAQTPVETWNMSLSKTDPSFGSAVSGVLEQRAEMSAGGVAVVTDPLDELDFLSSVVAEQYPGSAAATGVAKEIAESGQVPIGSYFEQGGITCYQRACLLQATAAEQGIPTTIVSFRHETEGIASFGEVGMSLQPGGHSVVRYTNPVTGLSTIYDPVSYIAQSGSRLPFPALPESQYFGAYTNPTIAYEQTFFTPANPIGSAAESEVASQLIE